MKNVLLLITFVCSFLVMGQNSVLLPSEEIRMAFEKQFPKTNPTWTIEYSAKKVDDIFFVANFIAVNKVKSIAVYDGDAHLKAYKTQITINKLPVNAVT